MRRKKIKPRFYLFLAIFAAAIGLAVYLLTNTSSDEDVIFTWSTSVEQSMDCVVIRDESVKLIENTVRIEYIGKENTEVAAGAIVANIFTTGYTENLLVKLETTRQNIQTYHKELLGTIVDSNLDRMDTIIDMSAEDFKRLVTYRTRGNLQTVIEQLETAMVNRQDYLRQNKRDDTKLTRLYEEENTSLTSIQSWRKTAQADDSGVLSFYLDGYESDLTPAMIESLTPGDIQSVLNGSSMPHTSSILKNGIFRIVNQDKWYVALSTNATVWNPIVGQNYYLRFEGFDDLSYTAMVVSVSKSGENLVAVFEIDDPLGPMIYQRTGRASLSTSLSSLAVHRRSIAQEGGQTGIWLYDVPGGSFVPVDVLSTDGDIALIQPRVEGSLAAGQRVLVKK